MVKNIMKRIYSWMTNLSAEHIQRICSVVCVVAMALMIYNCHPSVEAQESSEENTEVITREVPMTTVEATSNKEQEINTITVDEVIELDGDLLPVPTVSENATVSEDTIEEEIEEEPIRDHCLYYAIDSGKEFYLDEVYQDYLWEKLKEYDHTDLYELCMALMLHESHFTIDIVSRTNDHGLMQINGGNYTWMRNALGIESLDDPYDNIDCGVYILVSAYEKFGDVESALVCYNTGGGHMTVGKKYSTAYSQCVINDMDKLHILYAPEIN